MHPHTRPHPSPFARMSTPLLALLNRSLNHSLHTFQSNTVSPPDTLTCLL